MFAFYPLCRQSLVTPIDWKRVNIARCAEARYEGRQSLVTPIDWKLGAWQDPCHFGLRIVANLW